MRKRLLRWGVVCCLASMAAWLLLPRYPLLEDMPFSRVVLDRDGRLLRVTLAADEKMRVRTALADISPKVIAATLRHEDRWYGSHAGINPVSTIRAAWFFLRGQARGGASTITMQVARLRFGLHTRTLPGKARQIFYALALERHYSKDDILEAYLNRAPYGGNIEGIGAASLLYLGRSPSALTWPEAVALSLIPQSPTRRRPLADRENPALLAAQARLYEKLVEDGAVPDASGSGYVLRAPRSPVFLAPHFVNAVLAGNRESVVIRSSLDLPLQRLVETRVAKFVERNRAVGIHNAAVLLLDTRTMEVLVHVGSADFFDSSLHGQVDGVRSARSPGSTLKPFIYALAIDRGLIHPHSLLIDAPRRYAGYNPENSDRDYAGPLSASEALSRSRNVPAVDLLARLDPSAFLAFLRQAGIRLPATEDRYGLSLALGGAEVTMEDIGCLYAMLANEGRFRPLVRELASTQPAEAGRPMLSRESAFLALDMLAGIPAPGEADGRLSQAVSWKTGTSHGHRDAWTAAVFDHYALAVWIGNFDGKASPAFVGRTSAAPLLFHIVDSLRDHGAVTLTPPQPPAEANLRKVKLCAVSGCPPNAHCPSATEGWFIPGVSPIAPCTIHREILVDGETGLRVPENAPPENVRRQVYEFWPTPLLRLFEQAGLPRRLPPPYLPGSADESQYRTGRAPAIVSPTSGQQYAIRPQTDSSFPLLAETEPDVRKLYWFADRRFLGTTSPRQPLVWQAEPGDWEITVLDDLGRADRRRVKVVIKN